LFTNPSPFRFLLGNLPPLSPSLHKGGGSSYIKRGFASLRLSFEEEREENLERGEALLLPTLPLPYIKRPFSKSTVIASEAKQSHHYFQGLLRHLMPRNDN